MIKIELHGRLGNQLFQYAAARSLYEKNKGRILISYRTIENEKDKEEETEKIAKEVGIVQARKEKGKYKDGELAGVGVAFKLACALIEEVPYELLELVAIGTVADMVSLTDE
ncbi:hypothetical protein, partial [Enterococcus cecorum]|uniref:hypothetical protein n=1 Tax=Enterococcus cecorum TaxID=44008 RepID=UPI001FACADE5